MRVVVVVAEHHVEALRPFDAIRVGHLLLLDHLMMHSLRFQVLGGMECAGCDIGKDGERGEGRWVRKKEGEREREREGEWAREKDGKERGMETDMDGKKERERGGRI